jgi:hypothetical protein
MVVYLAFAAPDGGNGMPFTLGPFVALRARSMLWSNRTSPLKRLD